MKKNISILIILAITILSFSINTSAVNFDDKIELAGNQEIEYYEDGSYAIITFFEETISFNVQSQIMAAAATQAKAASKGYGFYGANGDLLWTVTVRGEFSYNGNSATCTASSVSSSMFHSAWKATSAVASRSGANAIGNFTVKRYTLLIPVQTETVRLTITCSPTGVLS